MDELALLSYLRRRGINNISEKEFTEKLHETMSKSPSHSSVLSAIIGSPSHSVKAADFNKSMTESEAKEVVAKMWHYEDGIKEKGEHFSMHKAKEICEMYKDVLPESIKYPEIYVAINAQYHDYEELFEHWFGSHADHKLIESALVFWFGDVDYPHYSKVAKYFKD